MAFAKDFIATCFVLALSYALPASAQTDAYVKGVSIAEYLTKCVGKYSAAAPQESYIEGLLEAHENAVVAFNKLISSLATANAAQYVNEAADAKREYADYLLGDPVYTREHLQELMVECGTYTSQADIYNTAAAQAAAEAEAARKESRQAALRAAEEKQQAELRATQQKQDAELLAAREEQQAEIKRQQTLADAEKAKAQQNLMKATEADKAMDFKRAEALARLEKEKAELALQTASAAARKSEADRDIANAEARKAEAVREAANAKARQAEVEREVTSTRLEQKRAEDDKNRKDVADTPDNNTDEKGKDKQTVDLPKEFRREMIMCGTLYTAIAEQEAGYAKRQAEETSKGLLYMVVFGGGSSEEIEAGAKEWKTQLKEYSTDGKMSTAVAGMQTHCEEIVQKANEIADKSMGAAMGL